MFPSTHLEERDTSGPGEDGGPAAGSEPQSGGKAEGRAHEDPEGPPGAQGSPDPDVPPSSVEESRSRTVS